MKRHAEEIATRRRFDFGENWKRFLSVVNDQRIGQAEKSLCEMLGVANLNGKKFIDIGCGSGLFSLAAHRLGASVQSFDYDPTSVACTLELKRRYFPADKEWTISEGSILDAAWIRSLGQFDIVYSWGVLHHTGAMWHALANTVPLVAEQGKLFIAIYNDQGKASIRWTKVKQMYNQMPPSLRVLIVGPAFVRLWGPTVLRDLLRGKPFHTWLHYRTERGMTAWRDVVDWVGGYPFEVAKPEEVINFFQGYGFKIVKLKNCGKGHGCNEFVFINELSALKK